MLMINCMRWLRIFNRDQWGSGYSLSVVLMLPIFIIYILLVVELCLLFNSFQSVKAVMQPCGHAARVWWLHQRWTEQDGVSIDQMVHRAAVRNMSPFAIGPMAGSVSRDSGLESVLPQAGLTGFASHRYAGKAASMAEASRVNVQLQQREGIDGLRVRLEYDSPLWFPVLAPFLSSGHNATGFYRTIAAETWVPLTMAEAVLDHIGIPYAPLEAKSW